MSLALSLKENIMLKFKTRTMARQFAAKQARKVVDLGANANGGRWAVVVVNKG